MKLEKIKNMKQKIITIPIIMITLISFIIPNYVNAGWFSDTSDNMFNSIIDLLLYIPDSVLLGMQKFLIDADINYSDMIIKKSAADIMALYMEKRSEDDGFWLSKIDKIFGAYAKIPVAGDIMANTLGFDSITKVEVSNIKLNLMTIFSNKVDAFNVNFFKKTKDPSDKNIAANLRNVIATWYVTLRNIALVLMLLVLVFIGIKITISSVASDKAKYKQLLVDWIVGICLLISMHYIMAFSVNLVESIVDMFSISTTADELLNISRTAASAPINTTPEEGEEANTAVDNFYWALIYTVLVFYMLSFSWQYLKRVIKLTFLTLFAPIIAFSYPLDKITDGKSQGFDRWLKDYIFTLLVQPIHLLLYLILISSVQELVEHNPLYALVALGSLMPVEKLLREFLGFDRGHIKGPNPMGPLAAASVLGGAAKKLLPSNVKSKNSKNESNNDDDSRERPIDTRRGDNAFSLLSSGENDNVRTRGVEGENSSNQGNNNELDETGSQWQDYMDMQEYDGTTRLPRAENQNNQGNNNELDETGNQWQDYMDMQGYDETTGLPRGENPNNQGNNNRLDESLENQTNSDRYGMTGNKFKSIGRGIGAVAKMQKPNVVRGLKRAAKITGAVTLGSAGLLMGTAAGIASGDLSKVVEYGAAGAAGAGALGAKGTEGIMSLAGGVKNSSRKTADAFRSAYDPEKFQNTLKERQAKEDYKKLINDNNAMMDLRIKARKYNMSDKQLKETVKRYSDQGITNHKDIAKGMELQQEAGVSEKQAMGAIKLSKTYDASSIRKDEAKLNREIQSNLQGRDANPEQTAQKSIDLMKMVHGMTPMRRL